MFAEALAKSIVKRSKFSAIDRALPERVRIIEPGAIEANDTLDDTLEFLAILQDTFLRDFDGIESYPCSP